MTNWREDFADRNLRMAQKMLEQQGEIKQLREKVKMQAHELTNFNEALRRKNLELDALHMVWCDGGCPRGVHRYTDELVTEEIALAAERNTKRLRGWYETVRWRLKEYPKMSEWHDNYAKRAAQRTDLGET